MPTSEINIESQLLRAEIGETVEVPEDVDDEVKHLLGVIAPWGRRIGDLRFETDGAWKRSGTTVDSLAKELRLALQYPEGAAV